MSMEEGLVRLVQKIVRNELDKQRVRTSELVGRGGDTVISSMGNIYLQPGVNKAVYADGVEIPYSSGGGAGNLSNYMRKDAGGGNQIMYNDINFRSGKGMTFKNSGSENDAGAIRAYNGINLFDFIIDAPTGYLYLDAQMGIRFAASAATFLDMGTNRILNLGTPSLDADATTKAYVDGLGKAKVSSNDTTAGYLNGKLVAGANITLTEGTDGGNETLTIAATGGGAGYLPLTAGSGSPLTGDLYINSTTPEFVMQDGGVSKIWLQWSTNTYLDSLAGELVLNCPEGSTDTFQVDSVDKLIVADNAVKSLVDLGIQKNNPYLNFHNSGGDVVGAVGYDTTNTLMVVTSLSGDLYLQNETTGKNVYLRTNSTARMTISDSEIDASIPIHVDAASTASQLKVTTGGVGMASILVPSNQSAGLALGADNVDSTWIARHSVAYLLWKGNDTLYLYGNSGLTAGNSYTPTTRIAMDASGNWYPATTDVSDLGTSTYWWCEIYGQKLFLDDANTYIYNNAGDCEIHVASGKKLKLTVG